MPARGISSKRGQNLEKENQQLRTLNGELQLRLEEAEETIRAIREGEVDAIVVTGSRGEQIFSVSGADVHYRQIVETMKEAACTVTLEGNVLFANAQFGQLVQHQLEEVVSHPFLEFVSEADQAQASGILTSAQQQPSKQRIVFKSADGRAVPAHVSAHVVNLLDGPSICMVASDLTELENSTELIQQLRRQQAQLQDANEELAIVQEELRTVNDDLETRVTERTAALERNAAALREEVAERTLAEEALQQAHAKLAVRAAQLRSLAGELTLTEQRERRRIAQVLHDHLQQLLVAAKFRSAILGRAGDELIRQGAKEVEDLLDSAIGVSRSLTAELSPPILHEGGLTAGLEWLARWMTDKHSFAVKLTAEERLPKVAEDVKVLLFESTRELLFNAMKHAHVQSATVDLRQAGDTELQITVSDAGPGFDPANIGTGGPTGGGFGLLSIHERLDLIGGRMEIDSAPGRGSRFTLLCPIRQEPPAVSPVPTLPVAGTRRTFAAAPPASNSKIRILLADDHKIMREGLIRLLGHEPDIEIIGEAADGEVAVRLAHELRPDIVLMDLVMPKLSGIDATRAIREKLPQVHVIGLSMFDEAERAQSMYNAGAFAYLGKTGPTEALINAIRACWAAKKDRTL